MPCDPDIFDGMSDDQKRAALTSAQQAYVELMSGSRGVTFSYTQGNGVKTVSYQPTSIAALTMLIRQLQQSLGVVGRRAPIRFSFR